MTRPRIGPRIGVDLSRDWLDVFHPIDGPARIANTRQAIRAWLQRLGPEDLPVFEATRGCDGLLLRKAAALRRPVHRANPLHGWHFARSLNLPETDKVDARMLARMGRERRLEPSPAVVAERAGLAGPNGRRDQLERVETRAKNRLARTFSKAVEADIAGVLRLLGRRIARIEGRIAAVLDAHPDSARAVRLPETVPGVGRVASVTLPGAMPGPGTCDRRAVASLGGLAPKARESGKWRGRRAIGAGRRDVRRALCLAALSAMRHPGPFGGAATRMRAAGQPGRVIAIAIARKILTIASAVLRDETTCRHPQPAR